MAHRKTVLVVEDQPAIAAGLKQLVEQHGWSVMGPFGTLLAARTARAFERPDLAMVDLHLPDGDGLDLVRELRDEGVECAVCSGYDRRSVLGDEPLDVHWIDKLSIFDGIERVLARSGLL